MSPKASHPSWAARFLFTAGFVGGCATSVQTGSETHWGVCSTTANCRPGLECERGICVAPAASVPEADSGSSGSADDAATSPPLPELGAPRAGAGGSGGIPGSLSPGRGPGALSSGNTGGSPASLPAPPVQEIDGGSPYYALGGVTSDGHLVAAYWTGSREEVVLIDPATSATTFAGVLGDLYQWGAQLVYDDRTRMAYAVGEDHAGVNRLYSLSLETGESTRTDIPNEGDGPDAGHVEYVLCGVTSDHQVVAVYWVGTSQMAALLDPVTGSRTVAGDMGVNGSIGQFVYDDARQLLYVTARDSAKKGFLYTLSLTTGQASQVEWSPADINGGQLLLAPATVTSDGRLIGAYWTGLVEQIAVVDPTTGVLTPIGVLGDLATWDARVVYGGPSGVAYAIGRDLAGTEHFYSITLGP